MSDNAVLAEREGWPIRRATAEDVPWLVKMGVKLYGDRLKNVEGTANWLTRMVNDPNCFILRGKDAALIVLHAPSFFDPHPNSVSVPFFGGNPFALPRMFRLAAAWAKDRGYTDLFFKESTGVNIAPLARILGAEATTPVYRMRLQNV